MYKYTVIVIVIIASSLVNLFINTGKGRAAPPFLASSPPGYVTVDEQRHKFELETPSGSGTWPKINRSSRSQDASVKEGSLEYFEHMRRQLIPLLTENVKEKAVMYEKIQQEAYLDKRYNEERSRSFSHPKSDDTQLTGKTAKRAHSFGVLKTKRDRTNNENNTPFYTGSITRRTPVKVSLSNNQREPEKHHLQEPLKNNHNKNSFQYDNKPVVEGKTPSSPFVSARTRNKNNSDYVSVRALIKQWSDPDAKKEVQHQQVHEEKCKNRRSLPANFDASDILLKKKEWPSSKSVTETVHNKSKNNMFRSDWSLHAGVSSATNRGSSDRKQDFFVETRTRTKSEPSNYSSSEYDPALVEKYWSSSKINKENRDFKKRERETMVKKSETMQNTSPAISYSQQQSRKEIPKDMKSKNRFSEQPVSTARKSLPLIQKSEVNYVENYMDQKLYQSKKDSAVDGRKLKSNKKYATIPATRTKMTDNKRFSSKNERDTEEIARVNLNDTNGKAEEKSEETIKHPPGKSSSEQSSLTHRLPTYQEAIIPLRENDVVKEAKSEIDSNKVFEKDYVSVELLQQKRERDKIKSSTVTLEEDNSSTRKPTVNENFSRQRVKQVYATEVAHPVPPFKKLIPRNYEMTPRYFYSPKKGKSFSSVKKTTAFTNKSLGTLETDPVKSSSDKTQHHDGSSLCVKDVNNNTLPVYDGKTLFLTSQQRMGKNNSNRKNFERESTSKVEDAFISEDSKPVNEEQHILNDFEQLKDEQKTTLDADFKDRSKTHMDPNMAQQFKTGGGVSLSNIVHEGELLQLVAAEEKYWKDKVGRNEMSTKQKEIKKVENEKQERVKKMLREFKIHDQRHKIDYSEITDTLRAEEEYLAQEAEKLLKQRFHEKSAIKPSLTATATKPLQFDTKQQNNDNMSRKSHFEKTPSGLHSILKTSSRQRNPSSVTSSDDINLKPEADQAYHHKKILRSRSPVYICSGCRLPVEKDICLYVAELQSYWHEKCFRCSVCHSNLIKNEQTPKIRVMFSQIHCENCLSNKKTGGQSTMV